MVGLIGIVSAYRAGCRNLYEMAVDVLELAITSRIEDKEELPTPSTPTAVPTTEDTSCVMIAFDLLAHKRNHK